MALRTVSLLVVASVVIMTPSPARERRPVNATPFSHSPCSVLSGRPCAPYFCGVFNHGPCIPEIDYPIGENLQLTILSRPDDKDAAKYRKPNHDLDTISDLFAMLRACWTPPDATEAHEGMQMSVAFSFKRDGEIIAPPRVTYVAAGSPKGAREIYRRAIAEALERCVPFPLSKGLGGAIAGRPIMIRYVDNRKLTDESP